MWNWAENVDSTVLVVRVADAQAAARACARATLALSRVMGGVRMGVVGSGSNDALVKNIKSVAVSQNVSVSEYTDSLRLNQVCNVRMYRGVPRGRLPDVMVVVAAERAALDDLCARAESQRCLVVVVAAGKEALRGGGHAEVDFCATREENWGAVF